MAEMNEAAWISTVQAALHERLGWPADVYVERDGADVGRWGTFMTWNEGLNVVRYVWAGPDAATDPNQIVITEEPLSRAQLRLLLAQDTVRVRDVAHIVVKTAGHGKEIGDPLSGDLGGQPGELEAFLHQPRVERDEAGQHFVFFARLYSGGYARLACAMDGEGLVTLRTALPPGAEGVPLLSGQPIPTSLTAAHEPMPPYAGPPSSED